jgi:DNA repair and recombination RAD54-like protein
METPLNILPLKRAAPNGTSPSLSLFIFVIFFHNFCDFFLLTESRFNGNKRMKQMKEKVTDYSDPFAIHGLLDRLDSGRYGSVTDDIRSLFNRKAQMIHTFLVMYPELANESRGRGMSFSEEKCNVIDLDDGDDDEGGGGNVAAGRMPVVVIDSDDEVESNENRMAGHFQGIVLPKPEGQFLTDLMVSFDHLGGSGVMCV